MGVLTIIDLTSHSAKGMREAAASVISSELQTGAFMPEWLAFLGLV